MIDVKQILKEYLDLTEEELEFEFPSMKYEGESEVKGQTVMTFSIQNPNTMVKFLMDGLGNSYMDSRLVYHFKDGTVAKYIKTRQCYELRRYGKLFAILKWREGEW